MGGRGRLLQAWLGKHSTRSALRSRLGAHIQHHLGRRIALW